MLELNSLYFLSNIPQRLAKIILFLKNQFIWIKIFSLILLQEQNSTSTQPSNCSLSILTYIPELPILNLIVFYFILLGPFITLSLNYSLHYHVLYLLQTKCSYHHQLSTPNNPNIALEYFSPLCQPDSLLLMFWNSAWGVSSSKKPLFNHQATTGTYFCSHNLCALSSFHRNYEIIMLHVSLYLSLLNIVNS